MDPALKKQRTSTRFVPEFDANSTNSDIFCTPVVPGAFTNAEVKSEPELQITDTIIIEPVSDSG
jgi:hypothetical protein